MRKKPENVDVLYCGGPLAVDMDENGLDERLMANE